MGWTPIYIKADNKKVLVVGTGEVGTRRAKRFLEEGSIVRICTDNSPTELIKQGATIKPIEELDEQIKWAEVIIAASTNTEINEKISSQTPDKIVNRADYPLKGNTIIPTRFYIGDTEISIFTQGKSPLMAKELRKKIQSIITAEDINQIEIQNYTRQKLIPITNNQKTRRDILYKILENPKINQLIEENKINEAKDYIDKFLEKEIY